MTNKKIIWNFLMDKINNPKGVAGLMGNLYAESGLNPKNLQNTFNKKLNMTDEEYTKAVDKGLYDNFIKDKAGYGIAQWTYWTRKRNLLNYAKARKTSIGDINTQLEFLWDELQKYTAVTKILFATDSIKEASDIVLTKYEKPSNMNDSVKKKRCSYGEKIYKECMNEKYVVVTGKSVYIRTGPGVIYGKVGMAHKGESYIYLETDSISGWNKIEYDGKQCWISGKLTEVI